MPQNISMIQTPMIPIQSSDTVVSFSSSITTSIPNSQTMSQSMTLSSDDETNSKADRNDFSDCESKNASQENIISSNNSINNAPLLPPPLPPFGAPPGLGLAP